MARVCAPDPSVEFPDTGKRGTWPFLSWSMRFLGKFHFLGIISIVLIAKGRVTSVSSFLSDGHKSMANTKTSVTLNWLILVLFHP